MHRFLLELGMVDEHPPRLTGKRGVKRPVRVALFDDGGVSGAGPAKLERCARELGDISLTRIGAKEIRTGENDQFDVLVHPGGSASAQAQALGSEGRERVREFVRRGGGYVGICAGSYLAACNYDWSLGLVDAKVIDRAHWRRGEATVMLELTDVGRRLLGGPDEPIEILYVNGPILQPGDRESIPDFLPLAHYRSEVAKNGAPRGIMIGTPALLAGPYGKGRVVSISPHPEQTPGLERYVPRAIRWAAARDPEPAQLRNK